MPDLEPHQLLAEVYLARIRTRGKNTRTPAMQLEAHAAIMHYACLPFPTNAWVLGVDFVKEELPHVIRECPSFEIMQSHYIRPIHEMFGTKKWDDLYEKHNPIIAASRAAASPEPDAS